MATRTRAFGAGNRENHDSSDFYARFRAPKLSDDETVNPCSIADSIIHGDARDMSACEDNSIALVVTSPPYFAGKEYEQALGQGHIPANYVEFLAMLRDVFSECKRVLEPGGRIAINVANLGRKPYRSLSADVMRIIQDDLALLPRGEIIWQKARGATGSTAFGSYMSASNPVMRDLTERVIVASKGRFGRAIKRKDRAKLGLPHENTITKEEFFESTIDVWEIRPERARKIGHPAPFPVELPERLIRFYTYVGDVVLDPFIGSGTTAVAAVRNDRHYVGYDTDADYVELANKRINEERDAASA